MERIWWVLGWGIPWEPHLSVDMTRHFSIYCNTPSIFGSSIMFYTIQYNSISKAMSTLQSKLFSMLAPQEVTVYYPPQLEEPGLDPGIPPSIHGHQTSGIMVL